MALTLAHPELAFPGDITRAFGQCLQTGVELRADAGLHPVAPCAFDQSAAGKATARLGDAAPPHAGAAGMFRWGQPQLGHQLPWIVEALEVPDLGHPRHRDDEPDAAHRLNSVHDRSEAPGWQKIRDLPCQTLGRALASATASM